MKYLIIAFLFFHCNKELSTETCQTCTKVLIYADGKKDTLYNGDKFCGEFLTRMKADDGYIFNGATVEVKCK